MNRVYRYIISVMFLCMQVFVGFAHGNDSLFVAPFDFPLYLSGNFGELRSNHFHSGVDFKTQGVVGKPIRCVAQNPGETYPNLSALPKEVDGRKGLLLVPKLWFLMESSRRKEVLSGSLCGRHNCRLKKMRNLRVVS